MSHMMSSRDCQHDKDQLRARIADLEAVLREIAAWPWSYSNEGSEAAKRTARAALEGVRRE